MGPSGNGSGTGNGRLRLETALDAPEDRHNRDERLRAFRLRRKLPPGFRIED